MLRKDSKTLNLGLWELLFLVLDKGSVARAADERGLERTQVSRLIASLEEETGVQLIEHMGRRLMPTQAALEIRPKIEPMIERMRKALEDLHRGRSLERGSIRFGAMPGFLQTQVVPLLAEFQQAYPGVSFDVIGDDDPRAFMRGQTDLMLYYGPVSQPRLTEHWVTRSAFVPCASPQYLREHGTPKTPEDLSSHAGILYTGRVRPHSQVLEFAGRQKTFGWKTKISFNNILLAKTACVEGCGILLDLPLHHCFREILDGRLVPLLDGWHIPNLDNYIASTKESGKLGRVQLFIDWYIRRRREIEGEQKRLVQERYPFIADY